jgi:predicted dehydrogenase
MHGIEDRLMGSAAMRFRSDVALALSWIATGCIGQLEAIRLGWWREAGVPAPGSWRTDVLLSPSGVLEDLGPHLLDIAAAVLPENLPFADSEPSNVRLSCASGSVEQAASWFASDSASRYAVPDVAQATLGITGGPRIELRLSWVGAGPGDLTELRFEGAEGRVEVRGLLGLSTRRRTADQVCVLTRGRAVLRTRFCPDLTLQREAFRRSLFHFADFCGGMAAPVADIREIARVAHWMEDVVAADRRARTLTES